MITTENHNPLLDDPELRPSVIYDNAAYVQEARNRVEQTLEEQIAIARAALNFNIVPNQIIMDMPAGPTQEINSAIQAREMIASQSNPEPRVNFGSYGSFETPAKLVASIFSDGIDINKFRLAYEAMGLSR
jgi:hypothetical protein